MIQLYLTFFFVGACIFAAIVFYSKLQQAKQRQRKELHANIAKHKTNTSDPLMSNDLAAGKEAVVVDKVEAAPVLNEVTTENDKVKASKDGIVNKIEPSFDEIQQGHLVGEKSSEDQIESAATKEGNILFEKGLSESRKTVKGVTSSFLNKAFKRKAKTTDTDVNTSTDSASKESKRDLKIKKRKEKKANSQNAASADNISKNDPITSKQKSVNDSEQSKNFVSVEVEKNVHDDMADNVEIINAQPKRDQRSSTIVTELVARIKNVEPIEQHELLSLFRNHDFKFSRKVHIYGLNQLTDLWRDIEYELPSARFVELGVAIQLADREGPMSKKELHDFQQMALDFSNNFDSPFEFSMDIDEALIQARVLDQMGRRYDSMAVLNIVPRSKSGFRMDSIERCARDLGMSPDKNGIFLKTIGQKQQISVLYRLACTDSSGDFGLSSGTSMPIHDLVIYMNVPATKDPELVFQNMVKDVNNIASALDGKVVDREGKVMTQRSYTILTQQISDISFSMQQDGLIPGDDISIKLF